MYGSSHQKRRHLTFRQSSCLEQSDQFHVSAMEEAYNAMDRIRDIADLQPLAGNATVKSMVEGMCAILVVEKELLRLSRIPM